MSHVQTALSALRTKLGTDAINRTDVAFWLAHFGIEGKEGWFREGMLVTREELAQRWTVGLRQLDEANAERRLFSVFFEGSTWYLAAWRDMSFYDVGAINQAFGEQIETTVMALYWWRRHNSLRGFTLAEAVAVGIPLFTVLRTVRAYGANYRGEPYS